MLLYNQRREPLTWDARGKVYTWEPFGTCEVPDDLFPHIKAQKVPVDLAPVAPEIKAATVVDEQRSAARADEVLQLKEALRLAKADAASARQAAEDAESRRQDAESGLATAEKAIEHQKAVAKQFEDNLRACEELLADTSRKLDLANQMTANMTAMGAESEPSVKKTPRRG